MFDHAQHYEIIQLLTAINTKLDVIHHDQLHIRDISMATLQEVKDAQAAETQAIHDLTARLAAQPPAAATDAQLDPILATAQQNAAAINELAAPAPAPAA